MFADRQLTEHFSLAELTVTTFSQYQDENRNVTDEQIEKLVQVALLGEWIRFFFEGAPLKINSGYRCPPLNKAVGSSDRSQHLLCEAMDFIPQGIEIGNAFRLLWKEVRDKRLLVGQLIFETAERSYGATSWIHVSLGTPYRDQSRCAQVLRMEHGKYTFFNEATV